MEGLERKKHVKVTKNCYFLCWTNTEFDKNLKDESKRKKVTVPDVFSEPKIVIKQDFLLHAQMPLDTKMKCSSALEYMSMKYKGREYDIKDLALNSAKLAVRLAKFGVTFEFVRTAMDAD